MRFFFRLCVVAVPKKKKKKKKKKKGWENKTDTKSNNNHNTSEPHTKKEVSASTNDSFALVCFDLNRIGLEWAMTSLSVPKPLNDICWEATMERQSEETAA